MIEIGTVLQDRFIIEEQVGVGGMGAVYRATDQKFSTAVAIKETLYRDKDLAEAFEREARLLNGLHHPLFPHVSDHFTEGDGHFLVMEYIEGEDLSELLKRGERFPFETVMRWTLDLLDGLDHLHSQDPPVIHRDIKPNNLKLTSRGNIVLLDFGMAKETSGNTQGMRSVFGYSRRYSPLEQIEGTGTDVRSDIFSLGATLYHLLTGTPPVDVLRRASTIVAGRPDPLELASALNPEVPERIAALLNSALALNADLRFASARAMWSALEHSLDGQKSGPSVASATATSGTPIAVEAPIDDVRAQSFPAPAAFEAESVEESTAATSGSDLHTVSEFDGGLTAEATEGHLEEPVDPARIVVPVTAEPWHVSDVAPESREIEIPERKEIPISAPSRRAATADVRRPSPILLAVPVLLLVLGLVGYALFGSDSPDGETLGEAPAERAASPVMGPGEDVNTEPGGEANPSDDTVAPTEEPEAPQAQVSETDDTGAQRSPVQKGAEPVETGRAADETPSPAQPRPNTRGRTAAISRNNGTTRPRIVEDRVLEQPPVSSIESIMTGIPAGRPRGQNNRDVLEEDEMRRLRRQRRIERRSRQRWPLF